mgnify:CR=1 FL=1|jgi:F-box domain.
MSVITTFKIENEFSNLEENIKKLKLLNNSITFQIIIKESIKLLSSLSQVIEKECNLFGKKIAKELLINIISFLPCEYALICRRVCMDWQKYLKSELSKKILLSIPKNIHYLELLYVGSRQRTMTKIKNDIYICNLYDFSKINTKNFKIIKEQNIKFHTDMIYSNNNFICTRRSREIKIYSLNMELVNSIPTEYSCGLAIDNNNNIFISTNKKLHIYNLDGKLINSWNLEFKLDGQKSRRMAFNGNEIYMVDTPFNRICVFSYKGELIRSWGSYGDKPGELKDPWGICIYKDIIFVVDTGNKRIQAFTCFGKFILEYKHKTAIDIADIVIVNDYIYLTDWSVYHVSKFKIIY